MTNQEIFDKVYIHLITQNQPCTDPNTKQCKYKIGKLRCAIGCLIPDDDYNYRLEGCGVLDLIEPRGFYIPNITLLKNILIKVNHKI